MIVERQCERSGKESPCLCHFRIYEGPGPLKTAVLYPWGMVQDMPIRAWHIRSKPDYGLDVKAMSHIYEPHHNRASLQWLGNEVEVHGLEGQLHAANVPMVQLGMCHLLVEGYHLDTTVFQFHDCLFHSHNSREFEDAWLRTTAQEKQKETEKDEKYVRTTCGYTLVTIWKYEWVSLKSNDPNTTAGVGRQALSVTASHICQCQVLVCQPLGPICRRFSWSYTRTSPRWISIHPTGWRTSSGTYHPSSNPWRCPRKALEPVHGRVLWGCWWRSWSPGVPDQ